MRQDKLYINFLLLLLLFTIFFLFAHLSVPSIKIRINKNDNSNTLRIFVSIIVCFPLHVRSNPSKMLPPFPNKKKLFHFYCALQLQTNHFVYRVEMERRRKTSLQLNDLPFFGK